MAKPAKNKIWDRVWKALIIITVSLLIYIASQFTEVKTDVAVIKNTQLYHYSIIADIKAGQKEYILSLENQINKLNEKMEKLNYEITSLKAEIRELKRK